MSMFDRIPFILQVYWSSLFALEIILSFVMRAHTIEKDAHTHIPCTYLLVPHESKYHTNLPNAISHKKVKIKSSRNSKTEKLKT